MNGEVLHILLRTYLADPRSGTTAAQTEDDRVYPLNLMNNHSEFCSYIVAGMLLRIFTLLLYTDAN